MRIKIMLWGSTVGYLVEDSGLITFQYDNVFLNSKKEIAPIYVPLREGLFSFPDLSGKTYKGLPGVFADSLPDKFGSIVISQYLGTQGRTLEDITTIERLGYTGTRGMGALEYIPDMFDKSDEIQKLNLDSLTKLANDILSDKESMRIDKSDTMMAQLFQVSSSAGGARAKALIAIDNNTGAICSGQITKRGYTYWLLKFDSIENNRDKSIIPDEKGYTRVEYAYYLMAKDCGIIMNECKLHKENGCYHFMTKRFDRTNNGEKIHMVSLCGMAHMDYNTPQMYSYEQAANIMRKLKLTHKELRQMFRRIVFNECAVNYDDHTKNISFLMDKNGKWHLSPAYDLTYSYNPNGDFTYAHQMLINGKAENISTDDLMMTAKAFSLNEKEAIGIIKKTITVVNNWEKYAQIANVTKEQIEKIKNQIASRGIKDKETYNGVELLQIKTDPKTDD